MSYVFANNDQIYHQYEDSINTSFDNNRSDFLCVGPIASIFGVDQPFGMKYSEQIGVDFPEFTDLIRNGLYYMEIKKFCDLGKQPTFHSKELDIPITPNAVRYLYHALFISKYIKEKFPNQKVDIVEIGGGYGGLCYWLRLFAKNIIHYTIIDLPAACKLQEECLGHLNTNCKSITDVQTFKKSSRPLFAISNYGYSEFNEYYQTLYKNSILSLADAGFMIWNNTTGIYRFTERPIRIEDERPCFHGVPNKFIYF
jgi:hypothetical protein